MEQEQPVVSMSLEEPEVVAPPVAQTPPEPPVQATPKADDEPEPEGTIEIPQGKVVPLGAVQAERAKRKEAERLAVEKDAKIAELSQKAQAFDEAKSYLDQARPIIEEIRAKKNAPQPQPPNFDPALELEATEYAKDFDLFTAEGKPDVQRALRILKRNDERAARQAHQAVAPVLQRDALTTTRGMFQQMVSRPEQNGFKIDANLLAEAFNTVGPEMIAANPQVAEVLYQNTLGRQILMGHKPTQAPPPPLVSESVGAGKPSEVTLTDFDQRIMQASGMKTSDYKETRERYKPGQNNSLE